MPDKFSYILENLTLYSPSTVDLIIGFIIVVTIVCAIRWAFLYGYGYHLVKVDATELQRKKETLSDLILMKDIQTELEKEVEKAMLKATFQG